MEDTTEKGTVLGNRAERAGEHTVLLDATSPPAQLAQLLRTKSEFLLPGMQMRNLLSSWALEQERESLKRIL